MKTYSLLILFVIGVSYGFAQTFEVAGKDTINYTDSENKKQGRWIYIDKASKNKSSEGEYKDGRKEGVWSFYYPDGTLLSEITYKRNRRDGTAKTYHKNGKLAEEGTWRNNKWVGEYKSYYSSGKQSAHWNYNENGERSGNQKYFHENGALKIEGVWSGGKQEGTITEYYDNGRVKSKKKYENGSITESGIVFFDNVIIETEQQIEQINKVEITEKKEEYQVFNGFGQHTLYNRNKQVVKEGHFENGYLRTGKHYFYDESGKLIKTDVYENGRVIEQIIH